MANKNRRKPPTKKVSRQPEPQSWWKQVLQRLRQVVSSFLVIYGGIAIFLKAMPESESFYVRINPLLTIEAKSNQSKPFDTEFLLKNEGSFRLYNVEVITELIRAERTNNSLIIKPTEFPGEILFPDTYGNMGDILAGRNVLISIPQYLRQHMEIVERRFPSESWKKIALCHRIMFTVFPLNLLPIGKQRQTIGSFFDKEAGIYDWRQSSCGELKKALLSTPSGARKGP